MPLNEKRLKEAVQKQLPVFGFFSVDAAQLEQAAEKTIALLGGEDTEITRLDGPAPAIEEIVLAAGTISFFSTRRVIYLPLLKPTKYKQNDFKEFCALLSEIENAVVVLTCQVEEKWDKPSMNKTEQNLLELCGKLGMGELLAKTSEAEMSKMIHAWAAEQKTAVTPAAVKALVANCGLNAPLLENEVAKLAACAGYSEITPDTVDALGTHSLDADAFVMLDLLSQGRTVQALQKLEILLRMQTEPISIAGALAMGYLDMYRLCAARQRSADQVARDFGRSAYQLKKRQNTAKKLGKARLRKCLQVLRELDAGLKSIPDDRKPTLMQTAICELAAAQSA